MVTLRRMSDTRHSADDRFQNGKHDDTNINKSIFYHTYSPVKRVVLNPKQ